MQRIAVRRSNGEQVLGRVFCIGGILDSGIGNVFFIKFDFIQKTNLRKKNGHSSDYILQNIIRD